MLTIVFLATAWSPKGGGINTFNMDLAKAVAKVIGANGRVACVVPTSSGSNSGPTSVNVTVDESVTVVHLALRNENTFDPGWMGTVSIALQSAGISFVDWWIGHDVISGEAANRGREVVKASRTAVIMHMSYRDYQGYKHSSAEEAARKHSEQRDVLDAATQVLAVGPLLRDRALELTGNVKMLIPGMPEFPAARSSNKRLAAISFGRLGPENDRIKQGSLAVAAFGSACRTARETPGSSRLLQGNDASLTLLGVSEPEEERRLMSLAEKEAGRVLTIHSLPYDEDRENLFRRVAESNLALMLSWHEGFGLTGWEAIAAGVPLILSKQSGLFQLLNEEGLAAGADCVDIDGALSDPNDSNGKHYSEADKARVAARILVHCADGESRQRAAAELKKSLAARDYSWLRTARDLLSALGSSTEETGSSDVSGGRQDPKRTSAVTESSDGLDVTGIRVSSAGEDLSPKEGNAEMASRPAAEGGSAQKSRQLLWPATDQVELRPEFERFLDEHGIALEHPHRGHLSLAELYSIPDIAEMREIGGSRPVPALPNDKVVETLLGLNEVLLMGDSQSGKTSLAKHLYREFRVRGFVPVLLSDLRKPPLGDDIDKALQAAFVKQYRSPSFQTYSQLSVGRRAILVDDFHLMAGKPSLRRRFQQELASRSAHVIYWAHNVAVSIEDLIGFDDGGDARRYQILPLGHARRGELIEKWASYGAEVEGEERKIAQSVHETTRLVDAIIGKNFVPAYPPFVLALIQAQSSATAVDTSAGTHGYFYELLIRTSLARESTADEYDVTMAYLANLAGVVLAQGSRVLSMGQFLAVHRDFERRIDLELEFARTVERLKKRNLLVSRGDEIEFKYPYLYYYFAAVYLRDSLSVEATRVRVKELATTLHVDESANILLFLAHLTRDPFVIDTLLGSARSAFETASPATLNSGDYVVQDLTLLAKSTEIFLDMDPEAERRRMFEAMDEAQREAEIEAERVAAQEPTVELIRVGQALAALQLLGQVAKNFPGNLDADRKVEIVGECYQLGRRFLGWYLTFASDHSVELVAEVARVVQRSHPELSVQTLVLRAREILSELVATVTFAMVKRVSMAVGSRLLDRTYKRLLDEKVSAISLFDLSIHLDHVGDFPLASLKTMARAFADNGLPFVVLRALVTHHLHVFPVESRVKQAACAAVGMQFERQKLPMAETKLLPKPK